MKRLISTLLYWSLGTVIFLVAMSCLYRFNLHNKAVRKAVLQKEETVITLTQLRSALQQRLYEQSDPSFLKYQMEKIARQELSMAHPDEIIYIVKRP